MENTMIQRGGGRQEPQKSRFDREFDPPAQVNHFLRIPPIVAPHPPLLLVFPMRSISALLTCGLLFAASAAWADTHIFIIANQADGYGVDQCLAKGEKCGAHAAQSYCHSRNFAQATSYRRVDPDEITGSVPKESENCRHSGCGEYIAITCQR